MKNRTITKALAELNVIRALLGMGKLRTLPKGQVQEPASCPIANSFDSKLYPEVDSTTITVSHNDSRVVFQTPPAIARFVNAFDNDRYPQLIVPE